MQVFSENISKKYVNPLPLLKPRESPPRVMLGSMVGWMVGL